MAQEIYNKFLNLFRARDAAVPEAAFPVLFNDLDKDRQSSSPDSSDQTLARLEFFNAIGSNFTVLKTLPTKKIMNAAGLDRDEEVDLRIYFFWRYLTKRVYPQLIKKYKIVANNNFFGFSLGFPINETKRVILAEDPSPIKNINSSGYAFHGTVCDSTRALLNYVKNEMVIADQFALHYGLQTPKENPFTKDLSLDNRKKDANLQAWIDQKILLINTMLTNKDQVWKDFTRFLIRYLNDHGNKLVFILMGKVAHNESIMKEITNTVGENRHKVILVEHPNAENNRKKHGQSEHWKPIYTFENNLPFLKAAYHKYLTSKDVNDVIDWLAIANPEEGDNVRLGRRQRFQKLFEEMERSNARDIADVDLSNALKIIKQYI